MRVAARDFGQFLKNFQKSCDIAKVKPLFGYGRKKQENNSCNPK